MSSSSFHLYEIPSNWEFCFDRARSLVWYEVEGRPLFTPMRSWACHLDGGHPWCPKTREKGVELCREFKWHRSARWKWFRIKWANLFEGAEDPPGRLFEHMGLFLHLPNGTHFHLCGSDPEETDKKLEGIRQLFGSEGPIQPQPAETPFDNINAPLFPEGKQQPSLGGL